MPSKLSKHIIAVANQEQVNINNLKLQKVMFFTVLEYLKGRKASEVSEVHLEFVAWRYGPVIPEDYHYYKKYGEASILEEGVYYEELKIFDEYIKEFIVIPTLTLMSLSQESSLWQKSKDSIISESLYPKYTLNDLIEDSNRILN